jgi:GT2 family glycosyltransferase
VTQDEPSPDLRRRLESSIGFLNREIQRLEIEHAAIHHELQEIQQSYAWRIIDGYRRWLARHRDNFAVRAYEKIALWVLARIAGRRAQDEPDAGARYRAWTAAHSLTPARIASINLEGADFPYRPLISIVLSLRSGSLEKWLAAAIASVRAQLYVNWQLCVVGDELTRESVDAMLANLSRDDSRVERHFAVRNATGSPTEMDCCELVKGEFIVFLDQCGQLAADALHEVVKRLNRSPLDDLLYWDEDKLDPEGRRSDPFFKPDWSPDLLLSMNYVGECFVIRRSLVKKIGGLRYAFAPAETYDLALRAVEETDRIAHLSRILYHRRSESVSSRDLVDGDSERERHSTRALSEALQRRGENGRVEAVGTGLYAVRYDITGAPLVSIIIPTRDRGQLLRQCVESIRRNTDYNNYEIIVLDNDSSEPETLEYFKHIAGEVQIHRCSGPFNYSAMNNLGVARSSGDFVLFLNNDTQVIRRDWMRAMIEHAQRRGVGAVGAKLLFGDGQIQHAGVVLGIGGAIGHAFRFMPGEANNYHGIDHVIRNCSAVTAACMMMRRSVFDELGGFDEKFPIEFNDIDLCLRLRQRGYRVVYTPLALLYHYEGVSRRGMDATSDLKVFLERWGACLANGDPFYNRNLTLAREDWSIAL